MRAIQGALIVASTLQIVLGFSGLWRNVVRLVLNKWHSIMVVRKISLVIATFIQKYFSFLAKLKRSWWLKLYKIIFFRFLSPLSVVPLVGMVGFGLYELGFPVVSVLLRCVWAHNIRWIMFWQLFLNASPVYLACQMCGDWTARACHCSIYFSGDGP